MDQRIEKTYTSLQTSMRELLGTYTWDQITIFSLCEKANISRSTFYSHFDSKDELLDSLLKQFESAMQSEKNSRSVLKDGTFRFLPMLLIHVSQNRKIFARNNTAMDGYSVAIRFKNLIDRLVEGELTEAYGSVNSNSVVAKYISGGIYAALVHWSQSSETNLHFELLRELDEINHRIIEGVMC